MTSSAIQNIVDWTVPLCLVISAIFLLVDLFRPKRIFRASFNFPFPAEVVFRAYYPQQGDDLSGHPDEGLEINSLGDGATEVRLKSGETTLRDLNDPHSGTTRSVSTDSSITHRFVPTIDGTRVEVERTLGHPTFDPNFWLINYNAASAIKDWLARQGTALFEPAQSVPMMARSPFAVALAVAAVAVFAWRYGWQAGLAISAVIASHELGHVVADRMYGHRASSFIFVPFFGGLATLNHSASYGEHLVKVLAGPAFGLAACAALFGVFALTGTVEGFDLVLFAVIIHALNLLPILPLDGGHFGATIASVSGRIGRPFFVVLGAVILLMLAYVTIWVRENWYAVPVIAFLALVLFHQPRQKDALFKTAWPRLGWIGIAVASASYIALWIGHVVLIFGAQSATRQDPIIVLAQPELFRAVRISDERFIVWNGRGWWAPFVNRAPNWGPNLLDSPLPGDNRLAISTSVRWPIRIDLTDGRQCLAELTPVLERPWQPQRIVVAEGTIASLRCQRPADG